MLLFGSRAHSAPHLILQVRNQSMDHQHPPVIEPDRPPSLPNNENKPRRSPLRTLVWLVVLALVGAAAYFYWPKIAQLMPQTQAPAAKATKGRGAGLIPVTTAPAEKGGIGVYFTGLGVVTPLYTVTIKSRVDGQLMSINYKEGDLVKQGDSLLEIDPRPYEAVLTQAEGARLRDQALLENARVDLARYQTLWAKNAIPQQQLATQQALVAQYEGAVKTDEGQIEMAKVNIVYSHITSPITGRIGLRLVDPGNIVHATDSNGLLVITQIEPISVIFTIAEDQLPPVLQRTRAGQHLTVEAWDRGMTKKLATGTVATLDNQIDQTTGTLKIRAIYENKSDALYPNQFVNARLLVQQKSGVILVPNQAIQRNSRTTYVWVVKPDQTVTVRPIALGTSEGDVTEITSGLTAGDVVVTDGVNKLQEGSKISTRGPGAPGGEIERPGGAEKGKGKSKGGRPGA